MDDIQLPEMDTTTIRALGNAVNVKIVRHIAHNLFSDEPRKHISQPMYENSLS